MSVETFAWSCKHCGEYNVRKIHGTEAFREFYCGFCLWPVEAAPALGAESPRSTSPGPRAPLTWDEILRPAARKD